MIKTLSQNKHGRDFVMGDLHGCFDQLEMFMNFIQFNPLVDRIFSVGDLVDRGPKNLECLKLLAKPWFHAVKGNHEELMQDSLFGGPTGEWWRPNGGKWFDRLPIEQKEEVLNLVQKFVVPMPLLITVTGQFHVIHAELSSDVELTDEDLADEAKFKEVALEMGLDGASVIWGRNIFHDIIFRDAQEAVGLDNEIEWLRNSMFVKQFGPKLSHIFCGHSPTHHPTRVLGQTNLDTGAFLCPDRTWAGLTFTEPASGKFWKVTDDVNPTQLAILL